MNEINTSQVEGSSVAEAEKSEELSVQEISGSVKESAVELKNTLADIAEAGIITPKQIAAVGLQLATVMAKLGGVEGASDSAKLVKFLAQAGETAKSFLSPDYGSAVATVEPADPSSEAAVVKPPTEATAAAPPVAAPTPLPVPTASPAVAPPSEAPTSPPSPEATHAEVPTTASVDKMSNFLKKTKAKGPLEGRSNILRRVDVKAKESNPKELRISDTKHGDSRINSSEFFAAITSVDGAVTKIGEVGQNAIKNETIDVDVTDATVKKDGFIVKNRVGILKAATFPGSTLKASPESNVMVLTTEDNGSNEELAEDDIKKAKEFISDSGFSVVGDPTVVSKVTGSGLSGNRSIAFVLS